jgi:hypothetical protein
MTPRLRETLKWTAWAIVTLALMYWLMTIAAP